MDGRNALMTLNLQGLKLSVLLRLLLPCAAAHTYIYIYISCFHLLCKPDPVPCILFLFFVRQVYKLLNGGGW
ncbi:hypothetical protein HanLR1_Chr16g0625111 [Helianthus annuus]|nr:hypothetical protein HanHA89_Chr16g0665461 [Helianthus annuus]KAJ0641253.1 hypothetical protein HanLR1_Chr16g0625111 [Helianthus annuus]